MYAKKLSDLMKELGITQGQLAAKAGLDAGQFSRHLSGKQKPSALSCLVFAGLASSTKQKEFWRTESGLDPSILATLASGLNVFEKPDDVQKLIYWFKHPVEPIDKSLKETVQIRIDAVTADTGIDPVGNTVRHNPKRRTSRTA